MKAQGLVALLAFASLAGCTTPASPVPASLLPPAAPALPALPAPLALHDCRGSLHVWFVPIDGLAKQLPPEFPPWLSASPLAPPNSGQLEFFVINCPAMHAQNHNSGAPAALGLLAARVTPKDANLSKNATPYYALQAFVRGDEAEPLLAWSGMPTAPTEFLDTASEVPGLAVPTYELTLRGDASGGFHARVQGAQPEKYDARLRVFHLKDNATRALDLTAGTTLWEGAGTADFAADSAFGKVVPDASKLTGDHHVLVAVQGALAARP